LRRRREKIMDNPRITLNFLITFSENLEMSLVFPACWTFEGTNKGSRLNSLQCQELRRDPYGIRGTSVGTSASQSQWRTGMPIGKYTVVYDLGGNARKLCKIWFGPDEKRQKGQGYTFHEIKKRTWKENDK